LAQAINNRYASTGSVCLPDTLLQSVLKPARYAGGEMNAAAPKPDAPDLIRFAFCFPDVYEVGMSHLGLRILYDIINKHPRASCERAFAPWPDMADAMRKASIPLYALESRKPLKAFDVLGFTLQYELAASNVLEMLDLAGIPIRSEARGADCPLVIAGGPCALNPEPLAPFMDAFVIGDGEDVIVEILDVLSAHKEKTRMQTLEALAGVEGVYVPAFYRPAYHGDGTISAFTKTNPDAPSTVKRRAVKDLDAAPFPETQIVPYLEIVHDRVTLEIMRGCTRGCRFCQAGMLYRPVRERRVDTLVRQAVALLKATGCDELSLSSLSTGDYAALPELARAIRSALREQHVNLSLPSLRVDGDLSEALGEMGESLRKSSLTFAPEAGTQRLRDAINKGVTEDDLRRAVSDAFESGTAAVKLYTMAGLPTETDEDLEGIGDMARSVVGAYFAIPKGARPQGLRVSVSTAVFVPKPFTPFQWAAQDTPDELRRKLTLLRGVLKQKAVVFHWHEVAVSRLEAVFARGDRRLADALERAWRLGARVDGWTEWFDEAKWLRAFEETGLDPDFYACRARGKDEVLPWDFIDAGVSRAYLWKEYERALAGEPTPDCRCGCNGCGLEAVCGGGVRDAAAADV